MSEQSRKTFHLPSGQQAIRDKCFHPSGTFIEFPKKEVEQSIPERFEKIVQLYPDRIAVVTKERALTYDELNSAANRVARAVLVQRAEREEPIALLFEHGASVIAAILGVLKAGKIYVPLDPSYPRMRIASILEDSQTSLIVTNSHNLPVAKELAENRVPCLNLDDLDSSSPTDNPGPSLLPNMLATIFYTSGSTGEPKGVVQSHRNILYNVMAYTNDIHICLSDRLTLLHSCSSFASIRNLFGALLNGAGLYPFDLKKEETTQLGDWLISQDITIFHSVSTLFRNLTDTLSGKEQFPNLRLIQLSSDSVTPRDVEQYKKHFSPNCVFANRLGTTETGTLRRYFIDKRTPLKGNAVPVGYAVEGYEVLLVDDEGNDAGFNCVGEIAVKSRYFSPGYWRRPDLTEATFRPDPDGGDKRFYLTGDVGRMSEDGCLEYLGRKDFQVKVRGYRIETAEIESALLALKTIKEVVVKAQEGGSGDKRLVAYIVAAQQPAPSVSELRSFLNEKLPDYIVPSAFIFLKSLPLTPNGKVDRLALPDPGNTRPELDSPFIAPRTSIENALGNIWAEILSLDRVGIHDNFFDLGGHSLAASRIISRILKTFELNLPIKALFDSPTVADMAVVITQSRAKKASQEDLARLLSDVEALSEADAQRLLASEGPT